MNIFVAILGLGLLVLVHEAGHFYTARAVGMSPRRFYIGFPPAIWKTNRKGIEYGVGAIPLGGFVKIPGMHRPAPVDVDMGIGRVAADVPALASPTHRLRASLAAGDHDTARDSVHVLRGLVAEEKLEQRAETAATKSLDDKVLAQWLRKNRVDTVEGKLRFDGPNNYGDDLSKMRQVQDGKWLVVWPREFAAPGARINLP